MQFDAGCCSPDKSDNDIRVRRADRLFVCSLTSTTFHASIPYKVMELEPKMEVEDDRRDPRDRDGDRRDRDRDPRSSPRDRRDFGGGKGQVHKQKGTLANVL